MQINTVVWLLLLHLKHANTAAELMILCQDNANESVDIIDDFTPSWQLFNRLQWRHIILNVDQNIVYLSQYRDFNSVLRESSRAIWGKGKASETATSNIRNLVIATILNNNNVKRSQQIDSNVLDQ